MKFAKTFKTLVTTAALAVTGAAFAAGANQPDYDLLSGNGTLTIDDAGTAALFTASVKIIGSAPATYTPATGCDPFSGDGCATPDIINVPGDLPNIKWDAGHVFTDIKALGGFLVYNTKTPATGGTDFGGRAASWDNWVSGPLVKLSNISVNPTTRELAMDFESKAFGSRAAQTFSQKVFFVGKNLTTNSTLAPNSLDIDNYAFESDGITKKVNAKVTGLYFENGANTSVNNSPVIAGSGLQTIGNALGVGAALQRSTFTGLDFGVLDIGAVVAVPEPSTYALLGLGLAGVAFATRRRVTA